MEAMTASTSDPLRWSTATRAPEHARQLLDPGVAEVASQHRLRTPALGEGHQWHGVVVEGVAAYEFGVARLGDLLRGHARGVERGDDRAQARPRHAIDRDAGVLELGEQPDVSEGARASPRKYDAHRSTGETRGERTEPGVQVGGIHSEHLPRRDRRCPRPDHLAHGSRADEDKIGVGASEGRHVGCARVGVRHEHQLIGLTDAGLPPTTVEVVGDQDDAVVVALGALEAFRRHLSGRHDRQGARQRCRESRSDCRGRRVRGGRHDGDDARCR